MATSGLRMVPVLLLILTGFSLGAGVHADNSTFLTYNNTQEGFSIAYPEGAALLYADDDMQELSVLTPDNITMIRVTVKNSDDSLANISASMNASLAFLTDGTLIESGTENLGGSDAFFMDYQWKRDEVPIRTYTATTVHDGKQYSISYDNKPDSFEEDKILIDELIDTFMFIPREETDKYYTGSPYYPGTVYDSFGIPMTDFNQYSWNPYANYGWDGSTGYMYPSTNYNQFPSYTGYDSYAPYNPQYPQPTAMPTMAYTMMPTGMPTSMPTMQPYPTMEQISSDEIEDLINDGFDYLAKNQYKQAEKKFKKALDIDSSDYRALYGYAKTLFYGYEGKEEEALENVELAISGGSSYATDSQLALMYTLKASIEKFLEKYEDALESIEEVIAIDDEEYLAYDYFLKATILYLGYAPYEDVIEAAEEAVSRDPSNDEYQEFLDVVTEEAEGESGSSGGSVYPSVTPVHTSAAGDISFEGGDGSSLEKAVVILGAKSEMEGIGAEDTWISERYGKRNSDWKKGTVTLISDGGNKYDKYEIILADDESVIIWFDVTDFFGSSLY